MTTERAAVARPQLKGQHTPGESSEMAFLFPCFLFDVTKSFLFLNLSQVGRSQASDLAKQGVSGEFACSENPEVWGWRRGDWRQWCGECALERSACAGDTCLCVSSGPCPRSAPPPPHVRLRRRPEHEHVRLRLPLWQPVQRPGGDRGLPRALRPPPGHLVTQLNCSSSQHAVINSKCHSGWAPGLRLALPLRLAAQVSRHSPEQPRLAHPRAGTPACSKGRRSLDGALAPSTGAFISGAPGSFW